LKRVARTRWLDQWETGIEGIIEDLQKSGTIGEAVGNKMLTQQELIFIERLKRQSTYHPKTQMTTMRLQKWAMYFHQNDMKTRVGQSFYEAYSKERKAKLEKDDPRVSLLHFHLAASLNEADVTEIFKKTGFSMDESSPAPISSPTKFNTILETNAWYFPRSSDDTAFAQFLLKHKKGNGFLLTRRSFEIAARRGCYSLLKLFEAHDTWTFGFESGVLYCLAKLGGHTKTAEWLYSHREKSLGFPPRCQFQDPLDGGIYFTSDWLYTAWERDLASFPPAFLGRVRLDDDESSDEVSSIEDRMSDFKSTDEYPDSDDAKATSVSISNRSTVTPWENRTASRTLVARPKVPQLQLVQSIVLNGGAPTLVDWTPSVHFQDYGYGLVEVHAAVTGGIFMSWDASSGNRLRKARVVVKPMERYALSPDGTHLAYQQAGAHISVISTSAGAEIRRFDSEVRYPVSAITFSSDGRRLAFGTHIPERNAMPSKNVVQILDINSGELVATLKVAHLVEDLEFSPDGRLFAIQSNGVKIYDLRTRKLVFGGEILGKDSVGARFSPSGNFLAVWRDPGVIEGWKIDKPLLWADPLVQFSIPGHTSTHFGQSLAFSPDGRLLASSSEDDNIIRIWNLETREVLHMLEGYVIRVRRLEFSPDGQMVVSASMDGDVRLWKLPAHSNPEGVGEMQELLERIQDIQYGSGSA
jgi:WD40 repeat protein